MPHLLRTIRYFQNSWPETLLSMILWNPAHLSRNPVPPEIPKTRPHNYVIHSGILRPKFRSQFRLFCSEIPLKFQSRNPEILSWNPTLLSKFVPPYSFFIRQISPLYYLLILSDSPTFSSDSDISKFSSIIPTLLRLFQPLVPTFWPVSCCDFFVTSRILDLKGLVLRGKYCHEPKFHLIQSRHTPTCPNYSRRFLIISDYSWLFLPIPTTSNTSNFVHHDYVNHSRLILTFPTFSTFVIFLSSIPMLPDISDFISILVRLIFKTPDLTHSDLIR